MKRKTKNSILIVILIVTFFLMGLTIYLNNNTGGVMGGPPEMGEMPQGGPPGNMEEPPEKPEGNPPEMPNGGNMGEPPEKPDGEPTEMPNGGDMQPPEMPENRQQETPIYFGIAFFLECFVAASILMYLILSKMNQKNIKETFDKKSKIAILFLPVLCLSILGSILLPKIHFGVQNNPTGMPMNQNQKVEYSAKEEITSDENITEGEYSSENKDENAISINGKVNSTIENIKVTKTGDSDGGDTTSFYGTNSAIIARGGANVTIKNIEVETDASGANGVFSYGGSATTNNSNSDGTTITISNSKITTKKDNSGGIMTTGGGTTKANNLTITTDGTSSAAIRSDRGGGIVEVDGGSYTTNGQGSPTVYSTADITVKNATLNSTASEGIVIEGKNKVTIENVTLTDNNHLLNGQSTTYKNIFLYQSMSGDAATGSSEFNATNSTITTKKGDSFYITNTSAIITLENNTIKNEDESGYFLRAQKDSWGNSGKNGGEVVLNLINQKVEGNIAVDEVSTLEINMTKNSTYTGSINSNNTAKSIKLTLDKTSKITLTGDTYVSELNDKETDYSNINFNGYKLYVNGKAIN